MGKWMSSALMALSLLAANLFAATWPSGFVETQVAGGLISPGGMDIAPDGRVFIAQQKGQIYVLRNDTLLTQPVLNIQYKVDYNTERGVNGIVLDPDFATNNYLYIYYTVKYPVSHNRLSRYTVVNNLIDTAQETVLFEVDTLPLRASFTSINVPGTTTRAVWHMGGGLVFGNDGKIYVGVGEHEVSPMAQSLASMFGKILRLNPDGSIPTDNPFYNTATGKYRAIYTYGMRNPFTLGIQRTTGKIFANDVGDGTWEEVDTIVSGKNYGWDGCEGGYNRGSTTALCSNASYVKPLFFYQHGTSTSRGNCVIGGGFTNNFRPADAGMYIFGDFTNNTGTTSGTGGQSWIKRVNPTNGADTSTLATGILDLVEMKFAPNGNLYYLSRGYSTGTIDTVSPFTSRGQGRALKVTYPAAASIAHYQSFNGSATYGLLVNLGAGRSLKIPAGISGLQLFDLGGRKVWDANHLKAGETLAIPSTVSRGMLKYRWLPTAR